MKQGKDGWLELDPATDMSEAQREAWERSKASYAAHKAAREAYEAEMLALAPQGKTLVFGYNFGKASIKLVEAGERKAKAQAKPQQSLRDFLDGMATSGHSA